ncbi:MAB_1171c family putative transporter [Streptomyces lavendulae]|uniref:MAB_1171c family putative transporter n=1 Tax=Streptomyces lavendulae TaxID=1914 RepID=UPI0031EEB165
MQQGVNFYIPAAALAAVLLVKLPALVRGWRSPLVRTVNALILLHCAGFFFSAPPTVTAVNRLTGISNFSALLVHCILCAYACTCLALMENWRGDKAGRPRTRWRVRVWILGHCLVVLLVIVCFVLGDVPDERPSDFDTYYANTPFIGEMLVLYLSSSVVAAGGATVVCWSWSLAIRKGIRTDGPATADGWLRASLYVLGAGFLSNFFCGSFKLLAVAARWDGRNWDVLNAGVAEYAPFGAMIVTLGFLLPVFGPWLTERLVEPGRTFLALAPLMRVVRPSATGGPDPLALTTPWYAGPEQHLVNRMTNIQDGMLRLRPYCADGIREQAHREAVRKGASRPDAVAAGLAAMLHAAADARARAAPADEDESRRAARALRSSETEYGDLMVRVSRALPPRREPHRRGAVPMAGARRPPT